MPSGKGKYHDVVCVNKEGKYNSIQEQRKLFKEIVYKKAKLYHEHVCKSGMNTD